MNHFSNNFHFFSTMNIQLLLPTTINMVTVFKFIVRIVWNLVSGFRGRKILYFVRKMVKENGILLSRWIVEGKIGRHIEVVKGFELCIQKKSFPFLSTFPCWEIICFNFLKQNNFLYPFIFHPNNIECRSWKDEK